MAFEQRIQNLGVSMPVKVQMPAPEAWAAVRLDNLRQYLETHGWSDASRVLDDGPPAIYAK